MDCGDNSCYFAETKGGMRTNGGCRCLNALEPAKERELRSLITGLRDKLERQQQHHLNAMREQENTSQVIYVELLNDFIVIEEALSSYANKKNWARTDFVGSYDAWVGTSPGWEIAEEALNELNKK